MVWLKVIGSQLRRHWRCQVCFQPLFKKEQLCCGTCFEDLRPVVAPVCPVCLLPLPVTGACGFCLERPRPWKKGGFYGRYEGLLRELFLSYKFAGDLGLGSLLQSFLRDAFFLHSLSEPDLILPVPLATKSLRIRGYNQVWELCRTLSLEVGGKGSVSYLRKIRLTPAQSGLTQAERRRNLAGAFVSAPLSHKRVLLVDDVFTTGTTLEECTRTCLQAGAKKVEVLVLARA